MLLGLWWSNEPGWIGLFFTIFLLVRRTWVDWIIFDHGHGHGHGEIELQVIVIFQLTVSKEGSGR